MNKLYNLIKKNPELLHIIKQTNKLNELAITKNGLTINYIHNPNDKLKNLAVKQNGLVLQLITYQTKDLQFFSAKEICLNAVRQNGLALEFVDYNKFNDKDYENICINAIKQNDFAFVYVYKFTSNIIKLDKKKKYYYLYKSI
jgi:hypothetical protein